MKDDLQYTCKLTTPIKRTKLRSKKWVRKVQLIECESFSVGDDGKEIPSGIKIRMIKT